MVTITITMIMTMLFDNETKNNKKSDEDNN